MVKINKYRLKRKVPEFMFGIVRYLILIGFAYILLYPFIFMAVNTIKTTEDWLDPTVQWVPKHLSLFNATWAAEVLKYIPSFTSTLVNQIAAAVISFFSCAVAAYGLARFDFRGKKLLVGIMILLILVPDPMLMVASYDNMRHLDFLGILKLVGNVVGSDIRPNVVDTPFVFWLPALLGTGLKNGLYIYIFMQFFKGLPKELEEAAWIDGAGPWQTFFRIVMPSSGAASITVLVFSVVWYYNDYYQAQIFFSRNHPISVMLANFTTNLSTLVTQDLKFSIGSLILAACFITVLPLLAYFLVMQKKFVQSIATCGIVG
ncbi:MAG: carbohydrate ABC transporter permease [Clostridia bacterium]|nr:carbohydrate ABC transporter permease [Clostridia bacterium]